VGLNFVALRAARASVDLTLTGGPPQHFLCPPVVHAPAGWRCPTHNSPSLVPLGRLPHNGFAGLNPKFEVAVHPHEDPNHLPSAHTCFNMLCLPPYRSYHQMREKCVMMISILVLVLLFYFLF
jgi:hypothetical protein